MSKDTAYFNDCEEIDRLRAINAELLAALNHLVLNRAFLHPADWAIARTAIKRARENA